MRSSVLSAPVERALSWLAQEGLVDAVAGQSTVHADGITAWVASGVRPVDEAMVREAFGQAASRRDWAMVFSTSGFTRGAARWASKAEVGLVALTSEGDARPDPRAMTIVLDRTSAPSDSWTWRAVRQRLVQLPRAASISGVHRRSGARWTLTRLSWQQFQLDARPGDTGRHLPDRSNMRGPATGVVDILGRLPGNEPLDLGDYAITVDEW